MNQYYLRIGEETTGPFTQAQIEQFWREARINAKTLYWNESAQLWKPVTDLFMPTQPPPEQPEVLSDEEWRQRRPYRLIHKRTWLVMWLCMFGFLHVVLLLALAIKLKPDKVGMEVVYFRFAVVPFLFVGWMSIWRMYKWGLGLLLLYVGLVFNQAYYHGQTIKWVELPIYVVILVLLLLNWKRMRWIRSDTLS